MTPTPNAALKSYRERANLSVRALANLAGVSHSTVSLIENGKRYGNGSLPALAAALGCKPSDLGWREAA